MKYEMFVERNMVDFKPGFTFHNEQKQGEDHMERTNQQTQ